MAQEKGKLLSCNRCGKCVFLKFLGLDPQEWSPSKEKYEKAPTGWVAAVSLGKGIDLCPDCAAEWTALQKKFMEV